MLHIYTRARACAHTHTHAHMHTCTHAHTHARTHPHTHTRIHAHTHTCTHHTHAYIHTVIRLLSHTCVCLSHTYKHSPCLATGWRRPIACLISWITFRKLATNYRALLREMTYKDKASYGSSPPCIGHFVSSFSRVHSLSPSHCFSDSV